MREPTLFYPSIEFITEGLLNNNVSIAYQIQIVKVIFAKKFCQTVFTAIFCQF